VGEACIQFDERGKKPSVCLGEAKRVREGDENKGEDLRRERENILILEKKKTPRREGRHAL